MIALEDILTVARAGNFNQAFELFDEFLAEHHDESAREALGHRAWLYSSLGKYENAVKDYQNLLAFDPDNEEARAYLAKNLCLSGEIQQARDAAFELLEKNHENPP